MDKAYIDSIYISARNVFQNMFSLSLKKGNLHIEENIVSNNRINAAIGVTGDLKGTLVYSFPENMAFSIVEDMSGMEVKEFDKFVASAIGELANIISGNAMGYFAEKGYKCDIVPPQVSQGTNTTFSSASKEIMVVPMMADDRGFELFMSITQKNK